MKYRIIKNGLGDYKVQTKYHWCYGWEYNGISYNDYDNAKHYILSQIEISKSINNQIKLKDKIEVVEVFDEN